MKYGKSLNSYGVVFQAGFTTDELVQMSGIMHEFEQSLYDIVGDIAVEANIIGDMAKRIIELEGKLAS